MKLLHSGKVRDLYTIDSERLKIIAPWFDRPRSAKQWELSYKALAAKQPEALKGYFEKLKQ